MVSAEAWRRIVESARDLLDAWDVETFEEIPNEDLGAALLYELTITEGDQ